MRPLDRAMWVDSFAGIGGASLGMERARGAPVDVAINHDPIAVAAHATNHPRTLHFTQDVMSMAPLEVTGGRNVGLLWASPDCRHHSRAKGGKPVSRAVRDLAWVVVRWARDVRPDVICLENVQEFRDWGPLDENDMPIKARKGETFDEWVGQLRALGYEVEWRTLVAADFGTPTIRKRLFLVARIDGRPIRWPEPSHIDPSSAGASTWLWSRRLPWRSAAECIDFTLQCPSIFLTPALAREFGVKRPLATATMNRIANGVWRYVIRSKRPFIIRTGHWSHQSGEGFGFRGQGVDRPLSTVTSVDDFGLVAPYLAGVGGRAGQSPERGVDAPRRTLTTKADEALIMPQLVNITHSGERAPEAVDEPLKTITGSHRGEKALLAMHLWRRTENGDGYSPDDPLGTVVASGVTQSVVAASLVRNNHGEKPADGVAEPLRVVTTQPDRFLLNVAHLEKYFGGAEGAPLDAPLPTVTAWDHNALAVSFLERFNGTSGGVGLSEPMPAILAGGNHLAEVRAFLTEYYSTGGHSRGLHDPMPTATTKDRIGLVWVAGVAYQITDIGMRMLVPRELANAQGFPAEYCIAPLINGRVASKTESVKLIGNSVCPQVAEALVRANAGIVGQPELWRGYQLAAAGAS